MRSFIKNRNDVRTLIFLIAIVSGFIGSLRLPFFALNIYVQLGLVLAFSFLVFVATVINHNHRHTEIFWSSYLNEITNYFITLCLGAPSGRLHQVHILNHHRHFRSKKDWTSHLWIEPKQGLLRICTYVLDGARRIREHRSELRGQISHLDRAIVRERIFLGLAIILAVSINYKVVLFLWIPAWLTGIILLFISNLLNHDACELESAIDHSRDFTNTFENYLLFNNGFHTAHHLKPAAHWSELASLHQN